MDHISSAPLRIAPQFFWWLVNLFGVATAAGLLDVPEAAAAAAEPAALRAAEEQFTRQIQPLVQKHCAQCHGIEKPKSRLNLSTLDGVLRGAASGPVIIPGKASESLLIDLIEPGSEPHMPPKGQLTDDERATFAKWIDSLPKGLTAGAEKAITEQDRQHWAFRAIQRPAPPSVERSGWLKTPIDAFILARLVSAELAPAPAAAKLDLIRRATFDLTGLPPTQAEVEAFLADESPDAYEKVLDRLLASPRYGERWGRHWLDLARYADSNGFEFDAERPNAYRYRDYVIRSFNADKPYDRFVLEQLAGDELAPQDPDALIATGFCRNGPTVENQANERIRLDELDDIVSTTSSVFLGLTIGCARCHDHKYDPIRQRDYYQLLAFFNNREKRDLPIATPKQMARHLAETARIDAELEPLQKELANLRLATEKGKSETPASDEEQRVAKRRRELEDQIRRLSRSKPQLPVAMGIQDAGPNPRPTHLLYRGDPRTPGEEVEPAVPAVLDAHRFVLEPPARNRESTGRRLALARWIASPENPLTARVVVNRIWQGHFGRGLVETSSNFGLNGSAPTHPELLDWLAAEFVAGGWKFKPLHKTIMLSAAYRQSTGFAAAHAQRDPSNAALWRFPPRRLDAEEIRDSILHASGKLNLEMYGPGIKPRIDPGIIATGSTQKWPLVEKEGPAHWRRSVYVFVKRSVLMPLLEGFDAPTTQQTCERRLTTTVATQALQLLNNPFTNEQAAFMAERVRERAGSDVARQVEQVYWLGLSRPPTERESQLGREFLEQQQKYHQRQSAAATDAEIDRLQQSELRALTDLCHVLLNLNEFVYVQ